MPDNKYWGNKVFCTRVDVVITFFLFVCNFVD